MQVVIREGKRLRTAHLDVRWLASPRRVSRVGFVVPKHRNTAVARNRLKRRLRELARLRLVGALAVGSEVAPADIVIRARQEAYGASYDALASELDVIRVKLTRALGGTSTPAEP